MNIELPKKSTKKVSLINILSGIFLELKGIRKEQKRMGTIYEEYLMNKEELAQVQAANAQLTKITGEYESLIEANNTTIAAMREQLDAIEANQADPATVQDAIDAQRNLLDGLDSKVADVVIDPPVLIEPTEPTESTEPPSV